MEFLTASFLSLLILLGSLFVYFYLFNKTVSATASLPPGKTGFPFIGETLNLLVVDYRGRTEKFIFDRVNKYSSYIFKTHLFGEEFAFLGGPSGHKFLFANEFKVVRGWWPKSVHKVFPISSDDQKGSSSDQMIDMRAIVVHLLKPETLKGYIDIMDHMAQRHFSNEWEGKKELYVLPLTKKLIFSVACKIFLSIEDPPRVDKLAKLLTTLLSGMISIPIDLPGTRFNRARKASKYATKEIISIINQRKIDLAEGKASPSQDILSHLLLRSGDENGKISVHNIDNIAGKIIGLLIGGHDTATSACTFIVKYLADWPEIYGEVHKEQMEISKSKDPGASLNWDDIQKMKYSWNVACEALRLVPPVQGAFREALSDFTFNGFSVPKGWKLYWSPSSTHKNPEFFPDPYKFDPSRFEGSGPAPYTFVPFGGGPRMCPGKEFARLEILVFMHHLVKRFRFEKVIQDDNIVATPVPAPANGLPIRLYPHV